MPVMEPVSDNEGVAISSTTVAVANTRPTTIRPVIANSSCAEDLDILSVPADHSSSHSFGLWEGVSHSVGVAIFSDYSTFKHTDLDSNVHEVTHLASS